MSKIDIVFDGPPSHESGRFVETEDENRASISIGDWVERDDGYWVLRIEDPRENEQLRAKVTLESRGIEDMRHSIDAALAKAEEIRVKQSVLTKIVEALIPKKPLPYRELEEELQTLYAVVDDTPVTGGIREEVVRRLRVARGDVVDDADTLPEEEK